MKIMTYRHRKPQLPGSYRAGIVGPQPRFRLLAASLSAIGMLTLTGCGAPDRDPIDATASTDTSELIADAGSVDTGPTTPVLQADGIGQVTPSQGPSSGGTEVVLKGLGFTLTESVWFGESKASSFELVDDKTLRVVTPPRPPGVVDVVVLRYDPETQESDELRTSAAFRYFATVRVDKVAPVGGPTHGGAVTTISGAGFRPGTHFVFGKRVAVDPVVLDEFTATVITPPGPAGLVDVTASNDDGAATLKGGYTYAKKTEPEATGITILPVKPDILDAAGGTPVEVRWKGSAGKLIGLRIGGLMASKLTIHSQRVQAVAPKGSPGPADVSLIFDSGLATLNDAVHYNVGKPFVAALLPASGAQSGGTVVDVVGGGLHRLTTLYFADKPAKKSENPHPGLARVTAPRGDPGTVNVTAHFSGAPKQVLHNAWAWFDPQQAGWGSWGGKIDGALNVTVRRSDWPGGIVQGARVVIGESVTPALSGVTDDRGQVTLSAHDLTGPVNVHASAAGYGAGSVVAFDATNVTILIRKHPPKHRSGGGGGTVPDKIFDKGTVTGVVRYADKLLKLPMGSCAEGPSADGQCSECTKTCSGKLVCSGLQDAVGGISLAASATSTTQRYCLRNCLGGSDCDKGWECRAVGTPGDGAWATRCVPQIGEPQTRCVTSSFSQFSTPPDPGPLATAAADGSFTLKTRLGEMAVKCTAGYVAAGTTDFVPLIMGVERGVKVPDDQNPIKTEVWLDTPLTRVAHFALEPLPKGPETANHRRFLRAWLDLGGEGFLELGSAETYVRTDRLDVARMPSVLKGALKNLNWTVYAGMELLDDDDGAPSSLALNRDVRIESGDHVAWWPKGTNAPSEAEAWSTPVGALSAGKAGLFAVGERGQILHWSGTAFTPQQSPTNRELRAIWLDPSAIDGWTGGDDGVLLRRDPTLGWQVTASPTSEAIIALSGGIKGPWMLDASGAIFHFDGKAWSGIQGPKISAAGGQPGKAASSQQPQLRTLAAQTVQAVAPAGAVSHDELWLAGEGGRLYHGVPVSTGQWTWTKISTGSQNATWLTVRPNDKAVWLAGEVGALALVTGGTVTPIDSQTTQPLRAIHPTASGDVHIVGGAGTWLQVSQGQPVKHLSVKGLEVDLFGVAETGGTWVAAGKPTIRIKPYLQMPKITAPVYDGAVKDKVSWTTPAGPAAEMHRIQITTYWRQSYWEIYAPGDVTEVPLAKFIQLGGWEPLPDGPLRVRVWRLFGPKLNVDHFSHNEMSPWYWGAWSYNWQLAHK
ncbi:MAG: IPT/TIG domain-containing protein [Myxococcales bacterium]|nr:IPT/TIG domain-containing protein [Myxococcales bacterium]